MTIIYDDVPVLSEEVKLLFHEINHCHDFQSLQEIWFRGPLLQAQKDHHQQQQQLLLLQQQPQENNFQAKPQYHSQASFINFSQSQTQQLPSQRTIGSSNTQFSALQQRTSYSNNNNNNNNNNQIRWTDLMNNLSDFEQDTLPDSSDEDETNPVARKTTTAANNNHHHHPVTSSNNHNNNNNQQQSTHQNNNNSNYYNNNITNSIISNSTTNELQKMAPKFLSQPVPANQLTKTQLPPQQPQQQPQQESQQPKEEVTRTQFSSPASAANAGRLLQSPGESSQKFLKRKRKYSSELLNNNNSLMSELVMDHPKTKKSPSHLTPSPITKASPVSSSLFSSAAFVDNQSETRPQPTQLHSFFSNTNDNITSAILSEELGITSFPITNDDDGNNHPISGSGSKNNSTSNNYEINNPNNNNNNHHISHEPIPYDEFSLDFTNMSKILSPDELAEPSGNNNINNNNINNNSKNNNTTPTMSSAGLFASVMMNISK
jgi:hypothetical protein